MNNEPKVEDIVQASSDFTGKQEMTEQHRLDNIIAELDAEDEEAFALEQDH